MIPATAMQPLLRASLPANELLHRVYDLLAQEPDTFAALSEARAQLGSAGLGDTAYALLRAVEDVLAVARNPAVWAASLAATDSALTNPSLAARDRAALLARAQVLRHLLHLAAAPDRTAIPAIIHLVKTDASDGDLPLVPYLCYRSAIEHCHGYRIVLHTPVKPAGPRWERLLPHLELDVGTPPQTLGAHRLALAAHQSDVWRVESLIRSGGFYCDWDLLLLRAPDALRKHVCVLGLEAQEPRYREVLGVSFIGAQPGSVFLQCWLNGMPHAFTPSEYVMHSTVLARDIALQVPELVKILPWQAFYYPGWSEAAMAWLFDPAQKVDDATRRSMLADTLGIHLFHSHGNFQRWAAGMTEYDILRRRSNLAELLAPYVDEG